MLGNDVRKWWLWFLFKSFLVLECFITLLSCVMRHTHTAHQPRILHSRRDVITIGGREAEERERNNKTWEGSIWWCSAVKGSLRNDIFNQLCWNIIMFMSDGCQPSGSLYSEHIISMGSSYTLNRSILQLHNYISQLCVCLNRSSFPSLISPMCPTN